MHRVATAQRGQSVPVEFADAIRVIAAFSSPGDPRPLGIKKSFPRPAGAGSPVEIVSALAQMVFFKTVAVLRQSNNGC
jgi:hypothetical protein